VRSQLEMKGIDLEIEELWCLEATFKCEFVDFLRKRSRLIVDMKKCWWSQTRPENESISMRRYFLLNHGHSRFGQGEFPDLESYFWREFREKREGLDFLKGIAEFGGIDTHRDGNNGN
jgi:hypothetical protein